MRKITLYLIAIIAVGIWITFGPSLIIKSTIGWEGAKAEFDQLYTLEVNQLFRKNGFMVKQAPKQKIINCMTAESIKFLTKTDCEYQYNQLTTTESEHKAKQDQCFARNGWLKQEQVVFERCAKRHFPNDWRVVGHSLHLSLVKQLQATGQTPARAEQIAGCTAPLLLGLFERSGCELLVDQAPGARLFGSVGECLKEKQLGGEMRRIIAGCGAKAP